MNIIRRFKKSGSLRAINFAGLSVMFACLLLSYGYIKRELSYDRHNANADRIARLSIQFDDKPVDGRIYGVDEAVLLKLPEIEKTVKLHRIETAVLTAGIEPHVANNIYYASRDVFELFDIQLTEGNKSEALALPAHAVVSESYARKLFGDKAREAINNQAIRISGRRLVDSTVYISGIFKDIPATSHFHTDMLISRPDNLTVFEYVYLLMDKNANIRDLEQKITQIAESDNVRLQALSNNAARIQALLTPLTDIHLHSRTQKEMEHNGNINYVYLVAGANVLLILVVMFNLWLNASLIFSFSRKYYRLLRMNGAPQSAVIRDEVSIALLLGAASVFAGIMAATGLQDFFRVSLAVAETAALSLGFVLLVISVSIIPALKNISSTVFLNTSMDLKPVRFSYSNVKYMLTAQYSIVMITVILAFGIGLQMQMVKNTQTGGNESNILVLKEQPDAVKERYALLKAELLKYPEIESVTAATSLPGNAILDYVKVKPENALESQRLPMQLVDGSFLSFFDIKPLAGRSFLPHKYDYKTESSWLTDYLTQNKTAGVEEEYIINRKAMLALAYKSPEEAIGQRIQIEQGVVDYIDRGVICGVTDDFNYTGLRELSAPLIVMQRQMFLHCIMVRLNSSHFNESLAVFERVWRDVNPDYPASYVFMDDVFAGLYRAEISAEQLVYLLSALCLLIAELGLIIFMAFIVKRRRKEIAIRKVHGASVGQIIRMLNVNFAGCIALAFVISVPVALYLMRRWLDNFAYRISLGWWIFAVAGLAVLTLSIVSVSWQSWRAANANPVDAIKSE